MRRARPLLHHCTCCHDCAPALPLDRRVFLGGGLAALGLASHGALAPASAQQAAKPHRIDVHHHFSPPQWIEDMDKGGVAAAMISITNPGLWFGDKEVTRRIARECNEYGAKLVREHPTRFGLFAALPLPDVDATLKEIEYAFDTLKADGAHFMTSYGDTWLGNAAYMPVMEELNRRKAVVHVHP